MTQEWMVGVMVAIAAAYFVWRWMPASLRQRLGRVHPAMGHAAGGCGGCSSRNSCGSAGGGAAARSAASASGGSGPSSTGGDSSGAKPMMMPQRGRSRRS